MGVRIPLPIHNQTINKVANSTKNQLFNNITAQQAGGNYSVLWEVRNGSETLSPYSYADTAAYTGLELYRQGNQTGAQSMLNILNTMYDGKGIVDEPYKNGTPSEHGIYQTYKLALHINLQTKLSQEPFPGQVENLLRMQGPDGGFHTGYDQTGTYAGTLANAETKSILVITLNQLAERQLPQGLSPFFQSFSPAFFLLFPVVGSAVGGSYHFRNRLLGAAK